MEWREVVQHQSLRDVPSKIETNADGYINEVAAGQASVVPDTA